MATLTVNSLSLAGTKPTFVAASGGGDDFGNDGVRTFLVVKNGGGAAVTVTINDTGSVSPPSAKAFNPDVDVTVNASDEAWIGPFDTARFGSSVSVSYSAVTSVTVAAVRL